MWMIWVKYIYKNMLWQKIHFDVYLCIFVHLKILHSSLDIRLNWFMGNMCEIDTIWK